MDGPRVSTWVVSAPEKALFDQIFETLDADCDGFIMGVDTPVKEIFIKTGLSHTALASIWTLCDIKQNGKLNSEQFALAMHFVNEVKKGHELPQLLTPEMVPPTLRPKPGMPTSDSATFGNVIEPSKMPEPSQFKSEELIQLSEELKQLQNEKNALENEVTQQETQMKLKESEIKSITNEIETLHQMIKQLDNQKVEAKKRLEDMDIQNIQLKEQVNEQKEKVQIEESELAVKKSEFDSLRSEEQKLQSKVDFYKNEMEKIAKELADSHLSLSQFKNTFIEFEEYEKKLKDSTAEFNVCIASKDIHKLNGMINRQIEPPAELAAKLKVSEADPFNDTSDFPSLSGQFAQDPFAGEDPFTEKDTFSKKCDFFQSQGEDFFANDAFANAFSKPVEDPFSANADDPFAPKPALTSGNDKSEGSTPELPPKKSKVPPPRPAPPKQIKPGSRYGGMSNSTSGTSTGAWAADAFGDTDPFSGSSAQTTSNQQAGFDAFGNFANFANFEKAFIPPPVSPYKSLDRTMKSNTWGRQKAFSYEPQDVNNNYGSNTMCNNWSEYQKIAQEKERQRQEQIRKDYELALMLSKQET